jgi:hypothetical protein
MRKVMYIILEDDYKKGFECSINKNLLILLKAGNLL